MKKYLTILFCSAVISSPAYSSLTCINDYENNDGCTSSVDTAGDCGSLGYSTSEVSGCKKYLKCPFNSSYKICVAGGAGSVDCAELGFTDDDKTSWCKAEDLITCPGTTLTLCAAPDMVAITPTCEDLGFTQEEKPWCSSLEKCKYDETYTLCNTALNAKTCAERGFTADDKASWCDENSIVECKEADGTIMTLCSAPLVECPYGSVEACQEANPWGVCNEVDGCAQVTECADGYVNSGIPPQFTVEEAGTYGNGMHCIRANGCNAELNAYADRAVCTKGISVDPLTLHGITCFVCEEGYEDEDDGGSESSCSAGYAKNVTECGTTGAKGYTLNKTATDSAGCFHCDKKSCPDGTAYKSGEYLPGCCGDAPCVGWTSGGKTSDYWGENVCHICVAPSEEDCTYQYSTLEDAPKYGSASCTRDGVKYYKEQCTGTKKIDCDGTFTHTCTNAVDGSYYGTCTPKTYYTYKLNVKYYCGPSCGMSYCGRWGNGNSNMSVNVTIQDIETGENLSAAGVSITTFSTSSSGTSGTLNATFDKQIAPGKYRVYVVGSGYLYGEGNKVPEYETINIAGIQAYGSMTGTDLFGSNKYADIEFTDHNTKTIDINMAYCGGVWTN